LATKTKETKAVSVVEPRLKTLYGETVVPSLMKQFGYKNINEVPKLVKIIVNAGLGDVKDNSKSFNIAVDEIKTITGQKPLVTNSKLSVANFKVRKGMPVGAKVTLRGRRMYEFMDKLVSIALPRVRDFHGVPSNLDGRGNYTMGVREQLIFPEIVYDQVEKTRGFDITFVTSADTDAEGKALLGAMGVPFRA
jgi:large subunit ribosomal protein L5